MIMKELAAEFKRRARHQERIADGVIGHWGKADRDAARIRAAVWLQAETLALDAI